MTHIHCTQFFIDKLLSLIFRLLELNDIKNTLFYNENYIMRMYLYETDAKYLLSHN